MLYERGSATDCADGIVTFRDLRYLADEVCGASPCPLDDDEIREVFARCVQTADTEENLRLLGTAIYDACCSRWAEA
jgi:hypothetical protein